jgi:acetylornithine deacetylase/succinyl-diaminopimelate desuccinylase family protein
MRENIVELLSQLVKMPSPYFHEEDIMKFTYEWFRNKDIDVTFHRYEENKITNFSGRNVIARIKGKGKGQRILLNGHLDSVNVCNGWTKNPFEPFIDGEKLYGLGALDMKSGCAAMMIAVSYFKDEVKDFNGEIIMHIVSDEEGPYGLGTYNLIRDGYLKNIDAAIVTEPSSAFTGKTFPCLCLGARGGYNYSVNVKGKSAHAATPELGINALEDASKIMLQILNSELNYDDKLGKGSICITNMNGGGDICSVADTAQFTVFRHIIRGEDKDYIEKEFKAALQKANIKSEANLQFREDPYEGDGGYKPYIVDEDNYYTESLMKSIQEVTGKKTQIEYFSSIGDFNNIASCGIPTFVFGPDGGNFHSPDEYVLIDSVVLTSKVIYDFLLRVLANKK